LIASISVFNASRYRYGRSENLSVRFPSSARSLYRNVSEGTRLALGAMLAMGRQLAGISERR
jgi:hypothetical protein